MYSKCSFDTAVSPVGRSLSGKVWDMDGILAQVLRREVAILWTTAEKMVNRVCRSSERLCHSYRKLTSVFVA